MNVWTKIILTEDLETLRESDILSFRSLREAEMFLFGEATILFKKRAYRYASIKMLVWSFDVGDFDDLYEHNWLISARINKKLDYHQGEFKLSNHIIIRRSKAVLSVTEYISSKERRKTK